MSWRGAVGNIVGYPSSTRLSISAALIAVKKVQGVVAETSGNGSSAIPIANLSEAMRISAQPRFVNIHQRSRVGEMENIGGIGCSVPGVLNQ